MIGDKSLVEHKYEILTAFSNRVVVIVSGTLALPLYLGIITLFVLDLGGWDYLNFFTGLIIISAIIGIMAAFVLRKEYETIRIKRKELESLYTPYIEGFFIAIFTIYIFIVGYTPLHNLGYSLGACFVLLLFLGVSGGSVLNAVWQSGYRFWISLLSAVDWSLEIDKEDYEYLLRLRFEETKRYGGPLSLCLLKLSQYEVLSKKIGEKAVNKLLVKFVNQARKKIRVADYLGRTEKGQLVMCLIKIAGPASEAPCRRLINILQEIKLPWRLKGLKPGFNVGIVAMSPQVKTIDDLQDRVRKALAEAQQKNVDIIRY